MKRWTLVLMMAACDGERAEQTDVPEAFVLVDSDARFAGATLVDGTALTAMPIGVTDDRDAIVLRGATVDVPDAPGLVAYAHGVDRAWDTLAIGSDIASDAIGIAVAGDEDAERIATAIGATVERDDNRWILRGDDIWVRMAVHADASGVMEVFPIDFSTGSARPATTPPPRRVSSETIAISAHLAIGAAIAAPPPAKERPCADPIAGVWTAYNAESDHTFVLAIARTGDSLRGRIDVAAPLCKAIRMAGAGHMRGDHVVFGASSAPSSTCTESYAPDHFTGRLTKAGTLALFNNDGENAFDRPYTFTRTSCFAK